jgi:hypothetical protein
LERIAEYVSDDDFPAKTVWFGRVPSISDLPSSIDVDGPFVLFVAVDSVRLNTDEVFQAAESLLGKGMVFLSVWGPDCERFHDICDEAIVSRNPDETERNVIITTWHAKESLNEAVWFFLHCAWPAADYERTCSNWVAAVIGNPEWERQIRDCLMQAPERQSDQTDEKTC